MPSVNLIKGSAIAGELTAALTLAGIQFSLVTTRVYADSQDIEVELVPLDRAFPTKILTVHLETLRTLDAEELRQLVTDEVRRLYVLKRFRKYPKRGE